MQAYSSILKSPSFVITLIFIVFSLIGISNYQDYGISWDETAQREIGQKSYDYITGKNEDLLTYKDRDYGVAVELPLIVLEKLFNANSFRDVFLMRHLVTHFLFLISGVFFFLLTYRLTKSRVLASSAVLFLFLHPRIYGHSFYNTKDIPLMCFFIICSFLIQLYYENNKTRWAFLVAIFAALTTNIRVVAVLLPFFFGLFLLYQFITSRYNKKYLIHLLICLVVFCLVLVSSWPYLWSSPIENLVQVFINMSKFRWDSIMLFMGEVISSLEVPPYYLPVWFSISTPFLFLITMVSGILLFVYQKLFLKKEKRIGLANSPMLWLQLMIIVLPLLVVVIKTSVVYDGWRQFYFMYPSIILFGVLLIQYIAKKRKQFLYATVVLLFTPATLHLMNYHPFQQTFFSEYFLLKYRWYVNDNYEMDYWGTAYGHGIKTILKKDDREVIKISADLAPGYLNYKFLPERYKKRVEWVSIPEADYIVASLRWRYGGFKEFDNQLLDHIETPSGIVSTTYKTDNH